MSIFYVNIPVISKSNPNYKDFKRYIRVEKNFDNKHIANASFSEFIKEAKTKLSDNEDIYLPIGLVILEVPMYVYDWDVEIAYGKKIVVTTSGDSDEDAKLAISKAQVISDEFTSKKGMPRCFAIFPQYSTCTKRKIN